MSRWWAAQSVWVQRAVLAVVGLSIGALLAVIAGRPVTEFYRFSGQVVIIMLIGNAIARSVVRRRARHRP